MTDVEIPFGQPEFAGHELIVCLEAYKVDESWEAVLLLRNLQTGTFLWVFDDGCCDLCPYPFDDHFRIYELTELTSGNVGEFESKLQQIASESWANKDEVDVDVSKMLTYASSIKEVQG